MSSRLKDSDTGVEGVDLSPRDTLVDIKETTTTRRGNTETMDSIPAQTYTSTSTPTPTSTSTPKSNILSLFNFTTRKHLPPLLSALTLTLAAGILVPISAIFLGRLFDAFSSFGSGTINGDALADRVSANCIILVGLGAATWVLNGGYFTLWVAFGELQARVVREEMFADLLRKDLEWFEMRRDGMGSFLPRLQTQIRDLQMATSQPLGFAIQDVTTAIAALGLAFYTSWNLTLVTLAAVPVTAVALSFISAKTQSSIAAQQEGLAKASKLANNAIVSIDVAKCFNGQAYEVRRYTSAIHDAARHYLRQARANAVQIGFVRLTTLGMFVQGFWYGSSLVGSGKASSGDVLTTFWACLMATQAVEQILPQMMVLQKGWAAAVYLRAVLDQLNRRGGSKEPMGTRSPMFCDGDIEVRNLSFAYPSQPDRLVLDNCTFFFPAFETTFVVGKSGSGKSTLGNLLMRFYPHTSGDIRIDDLPIQDLDINWLRNNITLVQQESVLFNESILKNITFGRGCYGRIEMADIENCIDLAMLRETINDMPDGLDTVVGSGGNTLSGGQRQRVAVARARLRDTPILILDESTSALDQSSRAAVMAAIRKWRAAKTTIIITHDMSHINESDFVYILEDGKIAHEGYRSTLEKAGDETPAAFCKPKLAKLQIPRNSSLGTLAGSSSMQSLNAAMGEGIPKAKVRPASIYMPSIYTGADHRTSRLPSLASPFSPLPKTPGFHNPIVPPIEPPHAVSKYSSEDSARYSTSSEDLDTSKQFGENFRLSRFTSPEPTDDVPTAPNDIPLKRLSRGFGSENRQSQPPPRKPDQNVDSLYKILSTVFPTLTWGNRILLILGFFCALLHAAATPAFSFLFSKLLSTFFLSENRSRYALQWSLSVLAVAIGDGIASFLMHYLLEHCGQAWVDTLREEAMTRILDQPREWFEREKNKLSNLTTCLDRNAEEMRNLVGRFAGFVFVAIATMMIAIIWSLALCWKLTLVGLACAPVIYAITRGFENISGKWESRCNDSAEVLAGISYETFTYIKTVRALTLESYFHKKHKNAIAVAMERGVKRSGYSGFFFGLSESAILFVTALIFYYGAKLASSLEFSIEDILTVFSMLLFSLASVNGVLSFIPQINSSRDTATRLLRLANLSHGASHEHSGHLRVTNPAPIKFIKTNFRYPSRPSTLALQNFTLTIPANQCTAIVGQSGSGKSTIASLLMSLYPSPLSSTGAPTLLLGGTDIRRLNTQTLRSQIALVPQQPTLFPDTIRNNIAYALPSTSPLNRMENIRAAASAAGIEEFISSLPEGYSTPIGDGGIGLSGGQAQRLCIARALVRKPKVLVLDEATSNLDEGNAGIIAKTVRRLAEEKLTTVVVITHARGMMEVADKVVVVRGGRCVEEGGYGELVGREGGELRRMMGGGGGKGREGTE
ncbi:hypothetical protein FQN54_001827 [Arachnomyces sp. PD_36]|nr:hypothetical protein FQN54_001827 [Arachnomyces sp. PD_36]